MMIGDTRGRAWELEGLTQSLLKSRGYRFIGSTSMRGTTGDHKGPPSHTTPPSPLRQGYFPRKDGEPIHF